MEISFPPSRCLAVVEAKSTLTKKETEACASAVASLASLRPYGNAFIKPRAGGRPANEQRVRCQYSVLAFDTDFSADDWAAKEWTRLRAAAVSKGAEVDRIDRVTVLTRGMLLPPDREAIVIGEEQSVLRDWFLHLTNFLVRESSRRAAYGWSTYLPERPKSSRLKLEGNLGNRRSRPAAKSSSSPAPTGGGSGPQRVQPKRNERKKC